MGHDNLAYRQSRSLPDDKLKMKVMVSPPFDAGCSKPCIYPRGRCQTLDNKNGRPDNFYPDPLDSKGTTGTQVWIVKKKIYSFHLPPPPLLSRSFHFMLS